MKDSTSSLNWRIERKRMKIFSGLILRHFLLFWQPTMGVMIRNHETWLRPASWGRLCNKSYPVPPTAGPVSRLGNLCPARTLTRWHRISIPSGKTTRPGRPVRRPLTTTPSSPSTALITKHRRRRRMRWTLSDTIPRMSRTKGSRHKVTLDWANFVVEKRAKNGAQSKAPELKRHLSRNRGVSMASQRGQIFLAVFYAMRVLPVRLATVSTQALRFCFKNFCSQKIGQHQS